MNGLVAKIEGRVAIEPATKKGGVQASTYEA